MAISFQDARKAQTIFEKAQRILCMCHRNPDGDAVGSLLGMGMLLEKMFPGKPVFFLCEDPAPDTFSILPNVQRMQGLPELKGGDTIVFLDCAEPKQTGLHETHPQLFDKTYLTINIDHHPSNTRFGDLNFIIPDAASSCEIVVELADILGWEMNSDIATCLLTGVYTDTGGLLHSNTTAKVYRTVARLLRAGARRQAIVAAVFRTAKLSTLRLWGRVLEHITLTKEGGAISAITQGDFRATGAGYSELTGAIDYVNAVPGMRFSLILSERDGIVKGSLRTLRDDVDVAKMASKFSGGGHRKAAGFSVPGTLQPEVRWRVVEPSK
ncbi:MAG TPA: bifunctional oligoribonuclease/PAP phosphatase NrnA [Candidatus Peribacteraceae bacterium]|nr:bifunctional oligoribonuclease/PAP phosphatase NrnA [Candidatus Peribacteraceae bacterium]